MEKELKKIEAYLRKSISEEQLAIFDYLKRKGKVIKLLEEVEDEDMALKLQTFISNLDDIIAEEEVHVGQFTQLLTIFGFDEQNEEKGKEEAMQSYYKVINDIDMILEEDD